MYTAQGKINQQEVLQQYLPMVRRQALGLKTRLPSNIELDDLIQAGSIGLLDAMTRYDLSVGATFATFASQRIRGAMIDELRTRDWVPRSVRRNARAVEDAMHRVEQNLGRPAREREVASAMGLTLEQYQKVLDDTNGSQMLPFDDVDEEHSEGSNSRLQTPFAELIPYIVVQFQNIHEQYVETIPSTTLLISSCPWPALMTRMRCGASTARSR